MAILIYTIVLVRDTLFLSFFFNLLFLFSWFFDGRCMSTFLSTLVVTLRVFSTSNSPLEHNDITFFILLSADR
ncbi:hypothetical protein BDF20DRAFT_852489 [Mycotypha africana]|uniref:uncharacterized protein n=1 Tax=Mycotypha africana TaxID=64632 RepID=UPI0023013FBE|nr:uncharacterized protein BDF20DRAFT_852489 [Mycotypha africana]KAI8987838.1 hypothetical protein BDF20DRAFT_852489 [Mycotypha africana]